MTIEIHHGSENVYADLEFSDADLEFSDAEVMQAKAQIVVKIGLLVLLRQWSCKRSATVYRCVL